MKESEKLIELAQKEDNDIKSFALMCKALREKRSEKFQDWLPLLEMKYEIENRNNGSYSINTQDYGIIDYFPKANKVLIRKENN